MKKTLVFLLALGLGAVAARNLYIYPCSQSILYKIGRVDANFGVGQTELGQALKSAEAIWEGPSGRNLFDHDPQGELVVNFVYDTRQQLRTQIDQLERDLNRKKGSLNAQIAQFDKLVIEFNSKNAQFKSEVDFWNSRGGASLEEYDKLTARQKELQAEAESLNQMAKSLNQKTSNYNTGVIKINTSINTFNQELSVKPEEGIYSSETNSIDIFFITDKNELIHILAHEFGHARGLDHLTNPQAIMYPQTSTTTTATPDDVQIMTAACASRSYWDTFRLLITQGFNRL